MPTLEATIVAIGAALIVVAIVLVDPRAGLAAAGVVLILSTIDLRRRP